MAVFTRRLCEVVEADFDLGLEQYPIFDETYRDTLNDKIIKHYWFYEIGHETESMFRFALNRKMAEIMPYYNQLYQSTKLSFDPLSTVKLSDDRTNTHTSSGDSSNNLTRNVDNTGTDTTVGNTTDDLTRNIDGTDSTISRVDENVTNDGTNHESVSNDKTTDTTAHNVSDTTTDVKSRAVSSDTPQTRLAGDEDYASAIADSVSDTTGHSVSDSTGNETVDDNTITDGTTHDSTDRSIDSTVNDTTHVTQTDENVGTSNETLTKEGHVTQTDIATGTIGETVNGSNSRELFGYSEKSPAELIMKYRDAMLNIDMLVIKDLASLFMGLWDNGDSFTERVNSVYSGRSFGIYPSYF